jgi:Fe-S cluster assembly protein SufD
MIVSEEKAEGVVGSAVDRFTGSYEAVREKSPLGGIRSKAWNRLKEVGFPREKDGDFQYVRVKRVLDRSYESDSVDGDGDIDAQGAQIVFLNGRYLPEASNRTGLDGLVISKLSDAIRPYGAYLNNRWNRWLGEESNPFALLQMALHQEGVLIYVPPKKVLNQTIHIRHIVRGKNQFAMPRIHLFVGSLAEVKIVFETVVDGKMDSSTEGNFIHEFVDLGIEDGAKVVLNQFASTNGKSDWRFNSVRATLKRDSVLHSVSLADGFFVNREDAKVVLAGENGEALLRGAWRLEENQECHHHILMEHQAPHCHSTQLFKGVLDDRSRSSFEGKIYVHREAQKTDAFQLNNNLLLSDAAQAFTKPNLEIFADDVKASHGATVGKLNDEQKLYLRTRGCTEREASMLLVQGYLKEVIDLLEVGPAKDQFSKFYRGE